MTLPEPSFFSSILSLFSAQTELFSAHSCKTLQKKNTNAKETVACTLEGSISLVLIGSSRKNQLDLNALSIRRNSSCTQEQKKKKLQYLLCVLQRVFLINQCWPISGSTFLTVAPRCYGWTVNPTHHKTQWLTMYEPPIECPTARV